MGCCNLRSLLLAAIVLSNCITWTVSRHHYTHNVSGHRSRHRRQGAGLYLPASYVLPGGVGTGAWGEWGEVSPCSRTCGGGVASQKRICLEVGPDGRPLCTGGDTKYFSCQTQDCPAGSRDFRSEQCSEFDDVSFRGVKYRWVPYTKAPNPCELNCMPHGERFYYRQKQKVTDGTRCNDESFDVCVNGTCEPVGCDMMLGSNAREDKCRECRGNGTNCHTVSGVIDTQDLRKGYNDILLIPKGATTVYMGEVRASNNYLALRAKDNNVYYLNGEYHIDFPRSLVIAGTLWHYERSQQGFAAPDILRCQGPTTEPLYLSLLLQDDNVGIQYEYSIPTALAPPPNQQYNWVHDEFTPCSATCGGGVQTRKVTCRSRDDLEMVDESLCDQGLKPATNQTCNTQACAARWIEGPWSPCSRPCGEGGTRSRQVHCEKVITNGFPSVVGDKECFDTLGPKPELFQECNQNATCPSWFTGPWKPCDKLCGEGKQTRQVVCHQKVHGRVEVFDDKECTEEKPSTEQSCILHPCDGVDWVLSDWSGCDSCLSTVRTRIAECATKHRKVVNSSLCSYHRMPALQEPCDKTKLPACEVQWYATQWSNCSAQCGKGVQTRRVFCGLFDGSSVLKVDDSRCENETKYNDTKLCEVPEEKCPAKWFAGPWSECTAKCGGGEQFRRVMCLSGGKEVGDCDKDSILESTRVCNVGPCDKDEMLPLDSKSTPIMDDDYDYEECEEDEDYPEVGDEEEGSKTTFEDLMFSDSPATDEGSGTGSTSFTEIESEFTSESGSGDEPTFSTETLITESSGTGPTDTTDTDETTETESTEPSGSTESTVTEETEPSETDETETSNTGSTETEETESTETEETGSTETEETGSTVTEETDSTETSVTESSGSTETGETELSSSEGSTKEKSDATKETEVTETESTETSETGSTEPTDTSSTETKETSESDSTESTETSETGSTEPTETSKGGSTETTETSESGSTEPTETDSTETTETGGSTESTETDETSSTETTETSETASTEPTETGSTESTETGSTEPTETGSTEPTETGSTEPTETGSTETTETGSTETTETGSTEPTETGSTEPTETGSTEPTETDSTESTETGSTEPTETGSTESEATDTSTKSTESSSTEETTEAGTTESSITEGSTTESETEVPSTTETGETSSSETSAAETESTEPTETSSTEATESSVSESTEPKETGSTETTESGATETTETTESGSTETTETTESGATETAETTESGATETSETTESSSTETTESGATETTETDTDVTTESGPTTIWDWSSTMETFSKKPRCKARRKTKCAKSTFGCCPDNRTPAAGPFDEGCPNPKTCKDTKYGCCPDGVSPAEGPKNKGCPTTACSETLFGCCKSDKVTPAEGNDQEGCPPPAPACKSSKYGCCNDSKTEAKGPKKKGCPETEPKKKKKGCADSKFGCCYDNKTEATGADGEGCPCNATEFGCCPDGVSTANGTQMEGCVASCNNSIHGCCPDGETAAHGPDYEGCCLLYPYGCCPDNYKPAEGPHLEGCGCEHARFGCCPDNVTIARGSNKEGCGCQYTENGCCPDRHTEATGPNFEGCDCHTYQFGCCPDGVTIAKGPNLQGCLCQQSKYGCCGDGQTAANGPNMAGCDCSSSKFGCCPDGQTEAKGEKFLGCTDKPVNRQAACRLNTDRGPCRNYSAQWYYDMEYGGCSRFWYGGCDGNDNRFTSKEECEDVCVQPSAKDACNLPQVKGACIGYHLRWYYDSEREQCGQFVFGGCLGNANNFQTRDQCQAQCEPARSEDTCNLSIERGSCAGNFTRWGYNSESGRCEQFVWGGCEGNTNRFGSEAACMHRCHPPGTQKPECAMPQEAGNCTEKLPVWSFKQTENRCVPFYYTGCGGNENNFQTEESCAQSCPSAYVEDACTLPAATGECANYREKWYYDTAEKRCRQFYYGGCGGNDNNFNSQQECESRCSEHQVTTTAEPPAPAAFSQEFCFLEKDPGPCTQMESRWAYDSSLGACTLFEYGGCGGNRNNFPSQEYCQYYCIPTQDICQLPMRSGPCDDSLMRWFYDPVTDTCSQFTYGGCEGNDNRFETQAACERRCRTGPSEPVSVASTTIASTTLATREEIPRQCQVPSTLEECVEAGTVWYLDPSRRECVQHKNAASGVSCRRTSTFTSSEACERACAAFRDLDVCRYPVEPGPCSEFEVKFYYDASSDSCQQFTYGGCHGGPNRFSSIQECTEVCRTETDVCSIPPDSGNCDGYDPKWFYNEQYRRCEQFVFSGCGGNANRFDTQEECEGRCITSAPQTTTTSAPATTQPVEEECRTPYSLQPCGSNITAYYYDSARGACVAGDIGGCRYLNSYRSEEECERRCGIFRGLEICRYPVDAGPCSDYQTKYYFNAETRSCEQYRYSGCQGGPNRFSTKEECEHSCIPDPCQQAADPGPCTESLPQWHYEKSRDECIQFYYGGCEGNDNRFNSRGECERRCKKSYETIQTTTTASLSTHRTEPPVEHVEEECRTPDSLTPCGDYITVYYYDSARGACVAGDIGGCRYPNSYRTEEECERRCGAFRGLDVCKAPLNPGPCRQSIQKFYWDAETGRCQPFAYGGCQGGPNRFSTLYECEEYCGPSASEPACAAPVSSGSARCGLTPSRRWHYSEAYGDCLAFVYNGCDGNENNFLSYEQCANLCKNPKITENEVLPEVSACDMFRVECAQLRCEHGVRRAQSAGGCERCTCAPPPADCEPFRRKCETLKCNYGITKSSMPSGCEMCTCKMHPCTGSKCLENERCVAITFRNALTNEQEYGAECRTVNKTGYCPPVERESAEAVAEATCRRECNDDADCRGYGKCCARGCSQLCLEPRAHTTPLPYTAPTTHEPNIPQAPKVNTETEPEVAAQEGGKATLRCLFHGNPPPQITWRRGELTIDGTEGRYRLLTDGALEIVSLYRNDSGVYICFADNVLGTARQEIRLVVNVPVTTSIRAEQTTLTVGSDINLSCEIDGYPAPEVYWTKDGARLSTNNRMHVTESRLSISAATLSDTGEYGCHADNSISRHSSTVQIDVQGLQIPAKCTDNPFFANCQLIVRSKFCHHKYYSRFCCKSCVEAGQLNPQDLEMQADESWKKRK